MITYKPRRVSFEDNKTPVMYNSEIDELAHAILSDYNPELLRQPSRINAEHFLEQYLGANIQFHDIYNDEPGYPILALTTFTQGAVRIFDQENERISTVVVPERTVIIDNSILEKGKEGLALFTQLHEGGHLVLHWNVFADEDDREGVVDTTEAAIFCRRESIENSNTSKDIRSVKEWQEHQADYFAAAIAMPNATFRPLVNRFLRDNNVYKGYIRLGIDPDLDILAHDILPEYISETYGVSKRAARIKLRKSKFVAATGAKQLYF